MYVCTLTHFLAKTIFSRGYGGNIILVEIPDGWRGGGYFCVQKMEILGRRGAYAKFPLWWCYGYFLESHIINIAW